jgi:CRP/FNR family cyclic AMP-dependent transcriptional regulator
VNSSILAKVPIFSGLKQSDLDQLAQCSTRRWFKRGSVVVTEGDPADGLYVVVSGRIKVLLSDNEGKEVVLTVESRGACFGEIALLDEEPRSASVAALEKTELLIIYRDHFMDLLDNHPELARSLIRSLAYMVRRLTKHVENLALKDVYCRIVEVLERRSVVEDDVHVVNERLTHQLIADMIGAFREMVSRIMSDLVKGDYISVTSEQIRINRRLPSGW